MSASVIAVPGFADPVSDSQTTFRAVLDAMAHPGRLYRINLSLNPPPPLDRATAAIALTLVDQETAVFLSTDLQQVAPWFAFHAGCLTVNIPCLADFVLTSCCPDLTSLRLGTDEAPEASATVILQIAALGNGPAFRLSGPGLAAPGVMLASGLPENFDAIWRRNHALFPRGVDLVLCADNCVAALPRSVTVEAA